jgi:Ca2+-binding RTX toxin-like protein
MGGVWSGPNVCTVSGLLVSFDDVLTINSGTTLVNTGFITNNGLININGVLINTGTIFNNFVSASPVRGMINIPGLLNNFGLIANDNVINNDFDFNSVINHCGGGISGIGINGGFKTGACPNLAINDVTFDEGNSGTTNFVFTLTSDIPAIAPITVVATTNDGSATLTDNDYQSVSNALLTVPIGQTTTIVTVPVNGDTQIESDESFTVKLSNPKGMALADSTGIGTIQNDDVVPSVSISDATVIEPDSDTTTATFTVTLSIPSQNTITVDFTTVDNTAIAGSDYVSDSGTLTFAPGQTTKDIMISIHGDLTHEPDEGFFINISNPTNAEISDSQGVGTILDNDGMPIITINDAQVIEGDAGTESVDFTVNLSNPSQSTITIDFTIADDTAIAGSDYVSDSGTLTFAPGQTTNSIAILVNGDQINEADETFTVDLSNAQNAMTSDDVGVGTIINNDPIPSISINDVSITEENSGTTDMQFTASLNNPSGQTVTVDYTTADGTAMPPNDYSTATGVLTFAPGETTQIIMVSINGDSLNEPDEIFTVNLSNPINVVISDDQGVGTIINDDPVPTLSINNVSVTELDSDTVNAVFTVSLSDASGQTVTADFGTIDDTAQSSSDYMGTVGTVIFNPGEISQSITVVVNDDAVTENSETFFVTLSSETNAVISGTGGQGTILDNDPLPTVSINDVSVVEPDSGTTNAAFTVSLSNPSQSTITVDFTTVDGTAVAGLDYTSNSGTITFAPEETQKDITVVVNNDLLNEADETFSVSLSGQTNAVLGDGQGVGTIINNPIPTISVNDVEIVGEAGNVMVVFEVSDSTSDVVTVEALFGVDGDSATIGLDYVANPITVTFGPGETTKTVDITIIDDNVDESDESFTVTLSNPTNAIIGDGQAIVTIIDDDQTPTISINDISINEGNAGTTNAVFTTSLSNPSSQTIMVNFATGDGTASSLDDYVSDSGSVIFAPGETTKNVSVVVNGDNFNEADEIFFVNLTGTTNEIVNLTSPTNVVMGDGQAMATITNDDPLSSISITDVSTTEGNLGATIADLVVSLNAPSINSITVDFATADGTAISPDDYSGGVGIITFNPGETTKIISITINPDILDENDETFFVNISNPTNAAISDNQGIITILDDDQSSAELFCGLPIEEYDTVIDGTPGNDKLVGTNGDDLIRGYAGDDKIRGKKGNDCLIGGDGMDKIWGGDGKDTIQGGNQDDRLNGGKGDDKISGEAGNDRINGGKDNDIINGNLGADRIHGNQGNDMLFGDEGDDRIHGGLGNDAIDGGANFDKCKGGQGSNTIANCEDQENEMKEDEDEDPEETN